MKTLAGLCFAGALSAVPVKVLSPDGTVAMQFEVKDQRRVYSVTPHGKSVLEESRLSVTLRAYNEGAAVPYKNPRQRRLDEIVI